MLTGDNGILRQAIQAKEVTNIANEREAIELTVTLAEANKNLNSTNKYYVGTPLYDKTLTNGNVWNIIVINNNQEVYGSGWNYIPIGTTINSYGKTQFEWLVNYNDGQIIQLEKGTYSNLSYASSLAITDGLVFNADPLNMSDSSSWGSSVTLYGFDNNENNTWNANSLTFDGIDDYIAINGNLDVEDEITIEFYGKINDYYKSAYKYVPLFSAYSNTKSTNVDGQGMRMWVNLKSIYTNFGYTSCGNSNIWENDRAQWNLQIQNLINLKSDFMYTATYKHSTCTYSAYMNGILVKQEQLDENYWNNFKDNEIPNIEYFQIGKARWNSVSGYLNGDVYSVRIYNKCLSDNEVLENYDKTVAYHNLNTD